MPTTRAGPEALASLTETIRQLRAVPHVREKRPGEFHLQDQPFVQFHETDGALVADLRKASGSGFERLPVDEAPQQRKFVDEAKRRAAKLTDE